MKPFRRVTGATTRQRIRSTLRAALNLAVARRLISYNPAARGIELDSGKRPKALLRTPEHLKHWEATGEKPSSVMVWSWQGTGKVFTADDGGWLHPEGGSDAFRRIVKAAGLPPISFRDLRHLAATLTHAGAGPQGRRAGGPAGPTRGAEGGAPYARAHLGLTRLREGRAAPPRRARPRTALAGQPACAGEGPEWGGWDSSPGPADYESPRARARG
jgi:hypothetical protein